jgi:hypothetical protein
MKMKTDQILWAEIYIHGKTEERFNIERNPGNSLWKFKFRNMNLKPEVRSELEIFGKYIGSSSKNLNEIHCDNLEKLTECIFYFIDQIIRIEDDTEISLKY